jgi:tetratricopeptide (TPR) repeat protein
MGPDPPQPGYEGDHVDFSHGLFLGRVVAKEEHHHHHHSAPMQVVPQFLPTDIPDFTGRADQLQKLDELAAAPAVIISAVDGTPGVGKTTLAVHWAHSARERFPDGRIHLNLQGYAPISPVRPRRALGELLQMLGVSADQVPTTLDARSRMYRSLLVDRRVLLVLDNVADPEQVRPLLPNAPGCLVVITSRSRLAGLAVRDGAHLMTLDTLTPEESLTFFEGVLGEERLAGERATALRVARLCGFLPLALRITVVRLAAYPALRFADVWTELESPDDRLEILSMEADPYAAIRHVFSWSYDKLCADERRAFRLLSLHRGSSISTAAAEAMLDVPRQLAIRLLAALAGAHLIELDQPQRYRFHDLLRLYAQERCAAEEPALDRQAALERLLSWYVASGENADSALNEDRESVLPPLIPPAGVRSLNFTSAEAALTWFDTEYQSLLDIAQQAIELKLYRLCLRVPILLWSYFQRRSPWTEWLEAQRLGLDAARAAKDRAAEAWLLSGLGDIYDDLERYDEAIRCHSQALEVHRGLGDRRGAATALNNLGVSLDNAERYLEAIAQYEEAVEIFRAIGHASGVGMALNNLGAAYLMSDDVAEAARCYRQALESRRQAGDEFGEGMTLHNLGEVHEELAEFSKAAEYYRESLALHRRVGHLRGEARALHRLGVCLNRLGDPTGAVDRWRRALEIFEDVGDPEADDVITLLDQPSDTALPGRPHDQVPGDGAPGATGEESGRSRLSGVTAAGPGFRQHEREELDGDATLLVSLLPDMVPRRPGTGIAYCPIMN